MDIPLDAEVKCSDGTTGRSVCLIVNPVKQEVTHIVVETKGVLGMQYMVPVKLISNSSPNHIQLSCSRQEMAALDPFIGSQFVSPEDTQYHEYQWMDEFPGEPLLWPYSMADDLGMYTSVEQIPHGELGIHRGAHVEATNGHIGQLDEFIINPDNNHITHLVLRKGHLWGKKHVTIPVSDILRVDDDIVYLKLDKKSVKQLSGIAIS